MLDIHDCNRCLFDSRLYKPTNYNALFDFLDVALITKPIYLDDNLYFEVVLPKEIAYTYKIRPAKDFGILFVSRIP